MMLALRLSSFITALLWVALSQTVYGEVKVFKNFTLIDGTGRPAVRGAAMIVDNGRIRWVGPVGQLKVPASSQVSDLSGKFLMPGIINLHGHIGNTIGLKQDASFFTRPNIDINLRTYAQYGVTTVLSMGTDQDLIFKIRAEQRGTRPTVARLYTCGQGFIFTGGYGGLEGVNHGVSSVAEVEPAVAAQAAKHVDFIKLWMDDHLGTKKKMPYDIGRAIIESAHRHHLRATAHIFYLKDAKQLTEYGVDGLAHSVRDRPIDAELIASMKKHGTWQQAATLSREASMFVYGGMPPFINDPFFKKAIPHDVFATLKSPKYQASIKADPEFTRYPGFLETAEKNLKKQFDAGVQIGFGTDTGPPGRFPGYFEHWELQLMVDSGMTPSQVITAATKSSAEFLNATDLGTLETNKWADLIVLAKNPLENIKNSQTIEAVYIAGNQIK